MALIREYFELTKKYQEDYGPNTVLLMQVGSFFEVYGIKHKVTSEISGSRIMDFSCICELNVVEKNVCVGADNVVMAGMKDIIVEKYIRKLQEAGFTVVVYTQDAAAKNTTRSLAGVFSPGTFFPNESAALSNNMTCIWIDFMENKFLNKGKYVVVGIANIDIYTGYTSIFQFKETYLKNPTTYDELERFVSIYNPSEVILISNLPSREVDDVINYANIRCSSIHKIELNNPTPNTFVTRSKNCEKQTYQQEILNKFYKIADFSIFIQNFYDNTIATQAFCFLLDFVFQHNPNLVHKISEPVFENCSDRLLLANHSLKQLNIIDDDNYSGKYSSVLKLLNCCLTPMGKRKFAYNLMNPTTNIVSIQREYDITEHIMKRADTYSELLKMNLATIKDISKWSRQVVLKRISPKAFYNLSLNLESIGIIFDTVKTDPVFMQYLNAFDADAASIGSFCNNINYWIKTHFDIELAREIDQTQQFETNFIRTGIDATLDKNTQLLKESELKLESIRNYLNKQVALKEKKESEYVKIYETEKNNYSLICTNRRCKLLQDSLPIEKSCVKLIADDITFDFVVSKTQFEFHKQSATNNCIVDEQISALCKNISTVKVGLKDIITDVYNKIISDFETFQTQLESIVNFVTLVDVVYTKGVIATKYNYCKPSIAKADKSFVTAKGLRHCLIEHLQTNELYVTNDISLGTGAMDGMLLYGTNAVGKTSFIRALGVSLVMAQAGLFVPCCSFVYKPYKHIFTRILGNDNIFKGLSTFAVEMSELRTILRLADENSLILGDELCSGTENTSAISIFVAGIQRLHKCNSSFIFATHLHEIVEYEEITILQTVMMKHMAVVYNKELDALVYDRKLKDGPGNNMYGLEVCKSLSLPDDFLEAAYNIRAKYYPDSGSLLSLSTSHFNSKKIVNMCEMCRVRPGSDVHHLQYQNDADANGIIRTVDSIFHKNNVANLMTLCEKCHDEVHKKNIRHRKVKTTAGYKLNKIV
jgi:DNA mismatch repair protein MutS